jgi:hypothetical protein
LNVGNVRTHEHHPQQRRRSDEERCHFNPDSHVQNVVPLKMSCRKRAKKGAAPKSWEQKLEKEKRARGSSSTHTSPTAI